MATGRAVGLAAVARSQALQPVANQFAGGLVQVQVERGGDAQATLLQPRQAQLLLQQTADIHHKVRRADRKGAEAK